VTYRQVPSFIEISVQCEDAVVAALHFNGRRRRFVRRTGTFHTNVFAEFVLFSLLASDGFFH
jgi:hypothetical protein